MTNESVLRNYKHMCEKCKRTYPHPQCHYCDKPIAIEALEKQIAKEPTDMIEVNPIQDKNDAYIDADTYIDLYCPNCGEWVGMEENGCDEYCRNCGQHIYYEV